MNQFRSYKTLSLLGATLISVGLLGGCATTDNVAKAQATADQALQKANEANSNTNAARSEAAQASQKADQALRTAQEANSTANAAKAESEKAMQEVNALSEKIDRMFKKTMQK